MGTRTCVAAIRSQQKCYISTTIIKSKNQFSMIFHDKYCYLYNFLSRVSFPCVHTAMVFYQNMRIFINIKSYQNCCTYYYFFFWISYSKDFILRYSVKVFFHGFRSPVYIQLWFSIKHENLYKYQIISKLLQLLIFF